jgi:hypothetical protein
MQKIENFLEVLILEELKRAFAEVLILRESWAKDSNGFRVFMDKHSRCVQYCQYLDVYSN